MSKDDNNYNEYLDEYGRELDTGTPQQLGTHDIEVMNGDGYYNSDGYFVRFQDAD